ncbi:GntR family transcriptional regulator [Sedimentibacter sp. MB31-C6]|uniref:GntR family transcriptional regulator n=1 Tax=Sedimentibacter sp. MB31-C6 TaxID=3109366 RepID=UPI002DDD29DF|nr:GntR family transcriptional regulator [Sedimentibacter sp. MB36-C1]WSI05502.1 GntR family transcriptional regulator [Sedimentibacter sp. MB36-C1]
MVNIDYNSSKAIHEQIYEEFARLILSRALKPDEKLPSVRELASLIKVNPNTIQKAFKNLETDNYIYSVKGIGSFVKSADELRMLHIKKLKIKLAKAIKSLKELGLSDHDLTEIFKNILNGSNS